MKFSYMAGLVSLGLLAGCGTSTKAPSQCCQAGTAESGPAMQAGLGTEADLKVNVGDRVFFDFDQSSLNADATATLDRQVAWLLKYPNVNVLVAGNADERGTEMYDLGLGQRRAQAVSDYLTGHGVAEARIQTISYGKEKPVAVGSGETVYQQNRNAITSVQGENPQE